MRILYEDEGVSRQSTSTSEYPGTNASSQLFQIFHATILVMSAQVEKLTTRTVVIVFSIETFLSE